MQRIFGQLAVFLVGASALLVAPRLARAEQFILLDATFDYTWDDATNSKPSKSHFYVNEGNFLNKQRPKNWLSPVDYRNGTLHVRTEVFKKPAGDQQVGFTLCYIPNSGGYGCADTTYYKSTGVFDRETKMTDWWQNEELNWDQGIKQMDLIYAINDSGSGHITNYPELKDLTTPTRVRITMVQVSAGSTYDASIIDTMGMGGAGGAGGGSTGGAAGAGGSAMMPVGGTGGAPGSAGMGGLLGSGGNAAAGMSSSAGTSAGAVSTAGSTSTTPTGAAGSGSVMSGAAGASSGNDGGCSLSTAPRDVAGLGGALAALSALALARRTRRLLRR